MANSETVNRLYSENSREAEQIYRNVVLQGLFKDSSFQWYTFLMHLFL